MSSTSQRRTLTVVGFAFRIPRIAFCLQYLPEADIGCSNKTCQVRNPGHRHRRFEAFRLSNSVHRHIAAVAVSCYHHPFGIRPTACNALIDATHDILEVPAAPVTFYLAHEGLSTACASMRVTIEDRKTLRRDVLEEDIHAHTKCTLRTAVDSQ